MIVTIKPGPPELSVGALCETGFRIGGRSRGAMTGLAGARSAALVSALPNHRIAASIPPTPASNAMMKRKSFAGFVDRRVIQIALETKPAQATAWATTMRGATTRLSIADANGTSVSIHAIAHSAKTAIATKPAGGVASAMITF